MTTKPDYHQHEEYRNRVAKLHELRELGIEPYPHKYDPTAQPGQLQEKFQDQPVGNSEDAAEGKTPEFVVAGRMVLYRAMGQNAFATIQGDDGRIQVMFNRDNTKIAGYSGEAPAKVIEKKFDLGDIVGVQGHLFRTQKGELTVYAKEVTLLSKTLLPLPDKHAGLTDKELRYRKRWLDLISTPETRQTFKTRSRILHLIRQYLNNLGFLEVETPVVQTIYGGAEARPFETRLNALDQHMFLRISLEIPLKKLIIGGMDKVFEMGKVFRNEGIDRTHNPEFTMMEAYAAYWDYNDMMKCVENLYEMLAMELLGTTQVPVNVPGQEEPVIVDVKAPWKRISMKDSLKEYAGIDVDNMTDEQMRQHLLNSGHIDPKKVPGLSRGLLIGAMFEVEVEPHLIQPHHITDHPEETTPLCKVHRGVEERQAGLIERFESFILCGEICNAYSELNDPLKQRELLEYQSARRDAGDEEASPMDEEFLEAICQGMPPTGGVGIGIDRLVMLFTNNHSIRDVLYFPWMKPL
jgi:lysyl-tRNA synthetase class 2